ncbi:hypothetical protein BU23DRAFT_552647 [Bimuria novae-zelandiae CBS 107.79]|uniref:Transcription initiation factor IIF subunit beta n=1 Tax=Bimuria novae-zelandiae CBS 107.79 TaxID=1447943 RepID=A0A6A5VEV5_9PLEO|nr:hypothetical protein BU23DRAFT_552647 [Bimuria novae-zelandiae CBS 107.79]
MMKTEAGTPSFNGSGYMDDEFYEDTGELQMPREGQNHVMISRIPDWLYEHISNWDELAQGNDNDKIELGEVLVLPPNNSYDGKDDADKTTGSNVGQNKKLTGPSKPPSMRFFLSQAWHAKTGLPTAYEINGQSVNPTLLNNTYVFTEKDLPGYKANGVGQNKSGSFGGAVQDPKARVTKPRSKYRRAIPKETALIGSVSDQFLVKPLNTKEYITFNSQRTKAAVLGKNSQTEIVDRHVDEVTTMNKLQDHFEGFIRSANKPRSQQNKYNRMPQNELIDMLHSMFDDYPYWSMKAIKTKVKQPEAYLKETLPKIAELVKSGNFASTWKRLAMFNRSSKHEGMGDDTVKIEEEDDEDDMEDVV